MVKAEISRYGKTILTRKYEESELEKMSDKFADKEKCEDKILATAIGIMIYYTRNEIYLDEEITETNQCTIRAIYE